MSEAARSPAEATARTASGQGGRLGWAYAGFCLIGWLLYAMAGAEWQRGTWRLWEAAYEATLNLWAPMLLGTGVFAWVRWLQRRPTRWQVLLHPLAALLFGVAWQALELAGAWALFGPDHALALLQQRALWRLVFGAFVYAALSLGFGGVLHARRAAASALAAAQAESALVRAELAAISGKLKPHFLFNTLNSLIALTRKDAVAAEQALLRFARMMRYVLDTQRASTERVPLRDELDFVRDYLALESLRLGPRLQVVWQVDEGLLDESLPPLTLQPLVENSIAHGIAPRVAGGTVRISGERAAWAGGGSSGLLLQVADDGAGCEWPPAPGAAVAPSGGVGLGALRRRFELDYGGQARLQVHSAPGQGFRVQIWLPRED